MSENEDITTNEETPGAIPIRPLRPSELLELKFLARDTKLQLSGLMGVIKTANLTDAFPQTELRLDDVGFLCDDIIRYCKEQLVKSDLPKSKRKR